jgi:hypothetical protein
MGRNLRLVCLVFALQSFARGQHGLGELRLIVLDAAGLPLEASGELVGQATEVRQKFKTGLGGRHEFHHLAFGAYYLRVERAGFTSYSGLIDIRTELPVTRRITLGVAAVETAVRITPSDTLLDPHRTNVVHFVGADALEEANSSAPARAVLEIVQGQPGWLLEANGVLHPRGAEYNTQYVVDGFPITDNRSPGFAPAMEIEELQSLRVSTAGYPAEYGRKLGGVVEAETRHDARSGAHGKAVFGGGSFGTRSGFVSNQYRHGRSWFTAGLHGAMTDRYLDPPVEENFTNHGSDRGAALRLESDWTDRNRIGALVRWTRADFLAPNEALQQAAGQRQDRRTEETMGQLSYQRILSNSLLAGLRLMVRDLSGALWSNPLSTPVLASGQRGFRESYTSGRLTWEHGRHEVKVGAEAVFSSVSERFQYRVADWDFFSAGAPAGLRFADRRQGREQALFVQDRFQFGRWSFSAGLRWDRYRLVTRESGLSPRFGASYYWPHAGLVLRASYDRAFETPAIENLLLASLPFSGSPAAESLRLPVPAARSHFYQAGFAKSLYGKLRLDADWFRRDIRNFGDDSLLLNTGVSFPISFSSAAIYGFEARLGIPEWGAFSGWISYSNLVGTGRGPVTGGLFLGEEAEEVLSSTSDFRITQDQRNTVHARGRYQLTPRLWAALEAGYGTGLPVELEGDTAAETHDTRYGERILRRVDFESGRVRPSFSLDASAGFTLRQYERASVKLQFDIRNITNRLNLINFSGLFSGTAIDVPRSFSLRLRTEW